MRAAKSKTGALIGGNGNSDRSGGGSDAHGVHLHNRRVVFDAIGTLLAPKPAD